MTERSKNSDWWYVANGQSTGPVSAQDLRQLLAAETLAANTLVWKPGMEGWRPLGQIVALSQRLASARAGENAVTTRKGLDKLNFLFLDIRGRIDRKTFLSAFFMLFLLAFVVQAILTVLVIFIARTEEANAAHYLAWGVGALVVAAGYVQVYVGLFAIAVKRLHDLNRSAWWVLAYCLLMPFVMLPFIPVVIKLLGPFVWVFAFLALFAKRGTVGPNAYGPDPHWRAHLE